MSRRMSGTWVLAGLCSLTGIFVGAGEAEAGSGTGAAITITGTYKPGGPDPPYDYYFDVYLNPPASAGTNTFTNGDSFTIEGLAGVDANSVYRTPLQWSLFGLTPAIPPSSAPYASNLTFEYAGNQTYMATTPSPGTPIFLGEFQVDSTYSFPVGVVPYPSGTSLSYTYTIGGVTQTGLTFQIFSVPEPSSLILLATGVGVLPLIWVRKRRTRQRQQSS
jgi:hypothetical protein